MKIDASFLGDLERYAENYREAFGYTLMFVTTIAITQIVVKSYIRKTGGSEEWSDYVVGIVRSAITICMLPLWVLSIIKVI
jgi:hypothetical protein